MENEPKEYAKDLVWKYYHILEHTISNEYSKVDWQIAKQCALIAVDEILGILEDEGFVFSEYHDKHTMEYWLEVKEELK